MKLDKLLSEVKHEDKYNIFTYRIGKIKIVGNPPYSLTWILDKEQVMSPLDSYRPTPLEYLIVDKIYDCILVFQDEYIAGKTRQFLKRIVMPDVTFEKIK